MHHGIRCGGTPERQQWAQLLLTRDKFSTSSNLRCFLKSRGSRYTNPRRARAARPGEAQNMALHLHESFNGFWFDENGNGIKLCLLQPLDSIARHIQDAVFPLERRRLGSDLPT